MNATWAACLIAASFLATGCSQDGKSDEHDGIGTRENRKWNDPNFKIITIGSFNYTEHDIYDVYVLPLGKNDIDYAAVTTGGIARPRDAASWEMSGSGPDLAWDQRWLPPRRFKVWWFRVTNKRVFESAISTYDAYTQRESAPGSAWCEYEFEITEHFGEAFGPPYPARTRDEMVLYFFPDGTVEGHLEFGVYTNTPRVPIADRYKLPVLKDRACLRNIGNPFYGKKRPVSIN